MMQRCLLLTIAVGFVSCATLGSPRNSVPFRVEANVPDATVWVDDHLVGSVATLSQAGTFLRVGFHRVEIRHPDYYSFFGEVQPKSGESLLIHADLHGLIQ